MTQNRRLYPICSHEEYGFFAGRTADSTQILIGLACPALVAIFFDGEGVLLNVQRRHLEFLKLSGVRVDGELVAGAVRTYNIYDKRIPVRLDEWKAEIGFESAMIRVQRFELPDIGISIDDYPSHFLDVLSDSTSSQEERDDMRESMIQWDKDEQFVLFWGNDYWLDGHGEVVSS